MKAKILSAVLVILLMGLILPGCTSKAQLNELEAQVGEKELQMSELKGELSSKDDQINELEAQLANLESELATIPRDPTYDELMEFVARDRTNEIAYRGYDVYAQEFLSNAREAGIRGYPVIILIKAQQVWFFTGFYCTDRKDWVFILPTIDREVKLEKGEIYHELNGFSSPGVDDTIEDIWIFLN